MTATKGLVVAPVLKSFMEAEALPGTGVDAARFWAGMERILGELAPANAALLRKRDEMQAQIDAWHRAHPAQPIDLRAYGAFLEGIGYLLPEPAEVVVGTTDVDAEIASMAGPQLVVPVSNARYALNAANARWGSLYDALYGTDAIPQDGARVKGYDPARGAKVIAKARAVLDQAVPLAAGSHADATRYRIEAGVLDVALKDGSATGLARPAQCVGFLGDAACAIRPAVREQRPAYRGAVRPRRIRSARPTPPASSDVVMEAALTTIQDCEDSVAAVDAEDKVEVYRNWLGLMKGDLTAEFDKGGKTMVRRLNPDRIFNRPAGGALTLHGRSVMLVRNVGHHMMTDAVTLNGAGGAGDHPGRAVHRRDRAARHPRQADEFPRRVGLHREAEDARAGGSGLGQRCCSPASRTCSACNRAHGEDGHHGRGTAHHRQPQGLHRRGEGPRGVHQHRLPRPHGR